jgi:hypothetical protein
MASELNWNGKAMEDLITKAVRYGVDKTLYDGMAEAKRLVHKDTRSLESAIQIENAKMNDEGQIEGSYGPRSAPNNATGRDILEYAVFQEFLPGEEMPDGGSRTRKGGKPYMRPSQKVAESELMGNIADAYRGLS